MEEQERVTPPAGEEAEPGKDAKTHRRRHLIELGVVLFLLVVFVLLALPGFSVTQPGYYRRYPALAERMDHWAVSTHSRIACTECHLNPGVKEFLVFAAKAVPAFYSQLIEGPKSTNLLGPPEREACQRCHTAYRTVSPAGDLLIPHKAHVGVLKMECVACHKNLVHTPNRRGFNRPEMETCLECHDGDKASNECTDCHTRKQTPDSHDRKDWLQTHGEMAESEDCSECHDWTPKYCEECHEKRPASHVGNWKKGHGPVAKQRGTGCLVCHDEKSCKECH